jgi:putative tricarboxylic transport membrane protein
MSFNRKDLFSPLFILAFSSFIALSALKLGLGTISQPDAGFLPFWTSIFLFTLTLFLLLNTIRKKLASPVHKSITQYRKIIFIIASLLGYSLLLDILGFYVVTFLFMLILFLIERRKFRVAIMGGIAVIISVYILFELLLGVNFPKGILSYWNRL